MAQSQSNNTELTEIFKQCQKLLDEKLKFLKETIDYINENDKGIHHST